MSTIAVVGDTGAVGSRVAGKLAAAGHDVVGLSRGREAGLPSVRHLAVDLRDRVAATRALEGASAVYLTPPMSGADPLGLERGVSGNVIAAASDEGVEHVVMHTALHADRGTTGARILDDKQPLEEALASSGVGYTILRPAWFLQNLFGAKPYLEQGMFSMPWSADMVWGATDIDDLARAAAAFLERGPANRGFDFHLPGGITAAGVCLAVEQATGGPVGFQEAPSTRAAVDPYPISEIHKELYAELFDYFRASEYLGDPLTIRDALGDFAYGTLAGFVERELFAPVEA
jgi:uncharacterized protein YbjT (DUF2867 family)